MLGRLVRSLCWLRCRRCRSRDCVVPVSLLAAMLFLSSFYRVPVSVSDVTVERSGTTLRISSTTPVVNKCCPLTRDLERLDAFTIAATTYPSPSLDTSSCADLYQVKGPPVSEDERWEWQRLTSSSSEESMVFSAHYDTRWHPAPLVQVIGITTQRDLNYLFCRMWYNDSRQPVVSRATVHVVAETHGRRYAAFISSCPTRLTDVTPPYAVTLLRETCDVTTPNLLHVRRPPTSSFSHVNFTVCVTPLNYRYNNYQQLVEMIEVNRMFGAGHFVFYNYSTGPFVEKFLDSYRHEGLVTVVPWSIPIGVDVWPPRTALVPDIHYFGQLAALNDCLYRCLGRSSLVVFTDLDEVLVPRSHPDWSSMLDSVSRQYHPGPSSMFPGTYVIRSSFFRTDWPNDEEIPRPAFDRHLMTLMKTRRETKIYEWSQRSKMIVWTKAVRAVGVHEVLSLMPRVDTIRVDHHTALIHHYRLWFDDNKNPPVIDRSMHRFTEDIVARIEQRYSAIDQRQNVL